MWFGVWGLWFGVWGFGLKLNVWGVLGIRRWAEGPYQRRLLSVALPVCGTFISGPGLGFRVESDLESVVDKAV